MDRLESLFEKRYGVRPTAVYPMTGSASARKYFKMVAGEQECMGVIGTDADENRTFIYLADHFKAQGINVPQVYDVSDDHIAYIQENLGDDVLFDMFVKARRTGVGLESAEDMLCVAMSMLPKLQFEGARGLDFMRCHPLQEFDARSAMFDLNYFKYCFLKAAGIEFHEALLQEDFERFAEDLASCGLPVSDASQADVSTFLYRDFQARNVMVRSGQPYFIDFQSGRRGPIYYDVSSFIWHPRAGYEPSFQERMLETYLTSLSKYIDVDREVFMKNVRMFRLFRYLQILGAYGFRGWTEHKANFVVAIPAAVMAVKELLKEPFERYPYLVKVLEDMVAMPEFLPKEAGKGQLTVKVYSFSFKNGVPYDSSGNGGGYVFDCRSIHNPGRYEPYKKLTGRDEPVIRFLEEDGEVFGFLEHVYGVVDPHVETYERRGFTDLMVSFGCTGGQHRSVYCAEHLAAHLAEKYPSVTVHLIHREQRISQMFNESYACSADNKVTDNTTYNI